MSTNIIMHIDVNSAFLSWQATHEKQIGIERDIREVPSVIGGNEKSRHGIVLAKSVPAKKYKIQTGESLFEARQKCPNLLVVPPDYNIYTKASKKLREFLKTFTPDVEPFSIDECFIRFTDMSREKAIKMSHHIRTKIHEMFGYTVNIGISENKLLAKMAGDFEKPNKCHTCFPNEIKDKMWPLPVGDLFMVGRKTNQKLEKIGIHTIGDLANYDYNALSALLKSHGRLIYNYSWGKDNSEFKGEEQIKSVGNSSTLKFDVTDKETAHTILLSLIEVTAWRLREAKAYCTVVSIGIKYSDFSYLSRQRKLSFTTDCTNTIYENICNLFDNIWDGNPIRQLGVGVSDLDFSTSRQISIFEDNETKKNEDLDKTIDKIRYKYGDTSIIRGMFANTDFQPLLGGYPSDEYIGMSSNL
ncbi:DNA polymerase IV [Sedimentibacter sp. zth1]|uniref:Y-family DNA polymerase n=1 Tax=Sedimentibacter sp. zth1 TaxID=2816908 RepID=UPI001A90F046|nr:DNA polymerase IV [Sedimentibacter sp. zth1]QSX06316.1 DNA polymerase IV [Sedimentibacter sp. zth1]